jgi:hypothetical protein
MTIYRQDDNYLSIIKDNRLFTAFNNKGKLTGFRFCGIINKRYVPVGRLYRNPPIYIITQIQKQISKWKT